MWRDQGLFQAWRVDQVGQAQTCLGVDLFEVIAELAQLDLEDGTQAAEAIRLAERAERGLALYSGGVELSAGLAPGSEIPPPWLK